MLIKRIKDHARLYDSLYSRHGSTLKQHRDASTYFAEDASMRFLLIVSTLCVVSIYAKEVDLATDKIMECVKELKIDTRDIGTLDPSKKGCLLACMYKKVNKDGQSLYDSFGEAIKKPRYMNSLGEVYDEDGALRTRLLSKLNKCHARAGKDDCKFMTCLNIFQSPFLEFLTT